MALWTETDKLMLVCPFWLSFIINDRWAVNDCLGKFFLILSFLSSSWLGIITQATRYIQENRPYSLIMINSILIKSDVYWTADGSKTYCDVRYAHTVSRPELTTWHAWIDLSWPSLTCRDLALFQRSDVIPCTESQSKFLNWDFCFQSNRSAPRTFVRTRCERLH